MHRIAADRGGTINLWSMPDNLSVRGNCQYLGKLMINTRSKIVLVSALLISAIAVTQPAYAQRDIAIERNPEQMTIDMDKRQLIAKIQELIEVLRPEKNGVDVFDWLANNFTEKPESRSEYKNCVDRHYSFLRNKNDQAGEVVLAGVSARRCLINQERQFEITVSLNLNSEAIIPFDVLETKLGGEWTPIQDFMLHPPKLLATHRYGYKRMFRCSKEQKMLVSAILTYDGSIDSIKIKEEGKCQ